jgi:hypothetical protein
MFFFSTILYVCIKKNKKKFIYIINITCWWFILIIEEINFTSFIILRYVIIRFGWIKFWQNYEQDFLKY